MSLTNYAAQAMMNSLFGKTSNFGALAIAPAIYIGLHTTAPGEDGTGGVECTGTSYARVLVNAAGWNAATLADPSLVDNASTIDFGAAGAADWGTLTHVTFHDATTAGNILAVLALTASKTPASGENVSFAAGDLDVTAD